MSSRRPENYNIHTNKITEISRESYNFNLYLKKNHTAKLIRITAVNLATRFALLIDHKKML